MLTDGPAVAELNAKANFAPDPQQALGLDLIFAVGKNGLPAAFSFCVICCRQNLKTGLLKQAAIGWLYVTDEHKVVWSAHEMSTTTDAQKELGELMEGSPALSRRMLPQRNRGIYGDNGSERIELRHLGATQQILFKARRKTGGRGLAGDKVVLDEAFALEPMHVGSLLPTMGARPHGQVLYASSAGLTGSEILRDVRDRGRAGTSPRMYYLEWGGAWHDCKDVDCLHPKDAEVRDLGCALDDRELWHKNNPTISTGRMSEQTIADLRQELPPAEFARECMGRWDENGDLAGPPAINIRRWADLKNVNAPAPAKAVIMIDVEPDSSASTISLVGDGLGGRTLIMIDTRPGTSWVAAAVELLKSRAEILEVSLHPSGQAGVLVPQLTKKNIDYFKLTHADMSRGCSGFLTGIEEARFTHLAQAELDTAVAVARTRTVKEAVLWDRSGPVPLGPVVAGSVGAHRWAVHSAKPKTPPPAPVLVSAGAAAKSDDFNPLTVGF